MKLALAVVVAVVAAAPVCRAQARASATFEAVSVKPNTTSDGAPAIVVDPGRFTGTNVAVADLVRYAWGFTTLTSQTQVVGGPPWIATRRFDIVATSNGQPTLEMLKALLEDRFKVATHVEARDAPVYLLLLDRDDRRLGPAIHVSTSSCEGAGISLPATSAPTGPRCGVRGRPGSYTGEGASMTQLARTLGNFPAIGRVVLDRTGLAGVFDWSLQWTPSFNSGPTPNAPAVANPDAASGVSLFTALREQLGLRLESQRAAVDVLVIDRAELPSPD